MSNILLLFYLKYIIKALRIYCGHIIKLDNPLKHTYVEFVFDLGYISLCETSSKN